MVMTPPPVGEVAFILDTVVFFFSKLWSLVVYLGFLVLLILILNPDDLVESPRESLHRAASIPVM